MNMQLLDKGIKVDMAVRTTDGAHLGTVADVWPNVDVGDGWDATSSVPQPSAEATDPELYTFSEGIQGGGDSYFRIRTLDGRDLYVPFSAVAQAEGETVQVAVDNATVPGLQWDVIPDFINIITKSDSQGGPHAA
ncbi:MAG TPA: hypothetical protein VHX16_06770 [Chloroflexota bacterium]|jgi:hypothetical protein|nr:hypothetical protein [Chloroflexota bacterium]